MLIDALVRQFEASGALAPVTKKLDEGQDAGLAVPNSARPLIVSLLYARRPRLICVVVPGEDAASRFANTVAAYLGRDKVRRISERQDRPWSTAAADPAVIGERLRAIHALRCGTPCVVVSSARALLRCVPGGSVDIAAPLTFEVGRELGSGMAYEELPDQLVRRGYVRADRADGPGTFAVHGDTVDIFPADSTNPVRIEFFGDEVDGLRRIVATTGQTIGDLSSLEVFPATEVPLERSAVRRAARLLEPKTRNSKEAARDVELLGQQVAFPGFERYLPYLYEEVGSPLAHAAKDALIVVAEPRALFDDASRAYDEATAASQQAGQSLEGLYLPPAGLDFGMQQRLSLLSILRVGGAVDAELAVRRPEVAGSPDRLFALLHSLLSSGGAAVLSIPDFRARESMRLELVEHALPLVEQLEPGASTDALRPDVVTVTDVDVPSGLIIPAAHLGIVSVADVNPRTVRKRVHRTVDPTEVTFPYKPGDYVVHATHGIALFKEIVRQEVAGIERDYLVLEYAKGDKLFVPVEQIDRVTRFVGPTAAPPRLTRLNTTDWTRATGKARKAAKKLAFDLVDLYARRSTVTGFRYSPDTPWQREMEEDFPYEETADQLAAVADVKADMESDKPMDRLICGDVGFGKTEVAVRAAFKAVQDHRQVLLLCPTTILAQQHYTTFSERMAPYGVRVEVLSRFKSAKEQDQALVDFSQGKVDVLVGTHRLLSSDVNPKDLGLIIIDEEQRFGVQHKEQLKNLREQVDVLAMSATPIPRTMQMALSGVRDMSIINTPPGHRIPVKVHVGEWDPDVVSQAIRYEVARKGQVYYVSNRVKDIDDAVERVHQAAPEARIGVAHGQMTPREVEAAMESFAAGQVDVLVATTIIESGIDNPHTNTLIIEDAQRLGLAQLYQLKGRVGRSGTQAFAYFMFPSTARLTEQAVERLEAIAEHQELGSGMKIAMKDLEIRGAGTLLGAEQHGNMSAVGFDLFSQMLSEAVAQARGEGGIAYADIKVELPVQYFLPEEYLPAADERVLYYRRIAAASDEATLNRIADDLTSRYGELPEPALNLLDRSRVKALAADLGADSVTLQGSKLIVSPVEKPRHGFGEATRQGGTYIARRKRFTFPVDRRQPLLPAAIDLLKLLVAAVQRDVDDADLANYSAPEGADGVARHEAPAARAAAREAGAPDARKEGEKKPSGPVKGSWTRSGGGSAQARLRSGRDRRGFRRR